MLKYSPSCVFSAAFLVSTSMFSSSSTAGLCAMHLTKNSRRSFINDSGFRPLARLHENTSTKAQNGCLPNSSTIRLQSTLFPAFSAPTIR